MRNHLTDVQSISILPRHASVAELVDAVDSKSTVGNNVGVRFSPEAPISLALKSSDLGAFLCLIKKGRRFFTFTPVFNLHLGLNQIRRYWLSNPPL